MIKLPILWSSVEEEKLQELGLPMPEPDYSNTREMVFFNINALSPYYDAGNQFTTIHCNGDEFVCTLPIDEVEGLVQKHLNPNPVLLIKGEL